MAQFSQKLSNKKTKTLKMQNTKNQLICPFEAMAPPSDRVRSRSEPSTLNDLKDDLSPLTSKEENLFRSVLLGDIYQKRLRKQLQ